MMSLSVSTQSFQQKQPDIQIQYICHEQHTIPASPCPILLFVWDGDVDVSFCGRVQRLASAHCIVIGPAQPGTVRSVDATPVRFHVCDVNPALWYELVANHPQLARPFYGFIPNVLFIPVSAYEHAIVPDVLQHMCKEMHAHHPWQQRLLRLQLEALLIRLSRCSSVSKVAQAPVPAAHPGTNDAVPFWRIADYLYAHFQDELSLPGLAAVFHLHPTRLSKQFRKQTGLTFTQFLQQLRLRHACHLLTTTSESGIDVAMACGFGSYKTFARLFQAYKGCSPTMYRKQQHVPASPSLNASF